MNTDIRLSTTFFQHRKTKKLMRLVGEHGVLCLLNLWTRVAMEKPSGMLDGWSVDDIEIEAGFEGDPGAFVAALISVGFLDENEHYSLHNWESRQEWVVNSQERSDKARLTRMAKTHKDIYDRLVNEGYTGITRKQYDEITRVQRPVNVALTPAPAPAPAPAPKERPATLPQSVIDFSKSFYEHLSQNGGKKNYTDDEMHKGAAEVDKLIRLDKYDLETEIKPALQWGLQDSFWSGQIRSLSQLRKKSKSNKEKKFTNLFNQFSARGVGPPKGSGGRRTTLDEFQDLVGGLNERNSNIGTTQAGDSVSAAGALGLPLPQ